MGWGGAGWATGPGRAPSLCRPEADLVNSPTFFWTLSHVPGFLYHSYSLLLSAKWVFVIRS